MKDLILILALSLPLSLPAHAQGGGGNSTGNGGKGINAYLTSAILKMDELLMRECAKPSRKGEVWHAKACAAADILFDRIMHTKIQSDYIVYGIDDDKPRDAVNGPLPGNRFFVTYSLRVLRTSSMPDRRRVLLHEFSTLADLETSDSYGYSTLILSFLSTCPELDTILADLPPGDSDEKTFRGLEATVRMGNLRHPVLIESTLDYTRFCVSRGFADFTPQFLSDVTPEQFKLQTPQPDDATARLSEAAVRLSDEGFVAQVVQPVPKKAHVIYSITCH